MARVLLLSAAYGEGHNAAARGLQVAMTALGAQAKTLDLFARTTGDWYQHSRRVYLELISRAPVLWAAVYRLIDDWPVAEFAMPAFAEMQTALAAHLKMEPPDAVVSVYPVYGYLMQRLYPDPTRRPFTFHTVVTDSITINSVWFRCGSDSFFVPNEETARIMAAAGVPPRKLHPLGFPVASPFADGRPERLPPGPASLPRVLFMINAATAQTLATLRRLLTLDGLHLTVTVGRDDLLRSRIEQLATASGRRIEIHGWTDRLPQLLMSHHVLIGKAGGATVQEAIAALTPMLVTQIVPGQEEGNARLLFENGCGAFCPSPQAVAETLQLLFREDAAHWREWVARMGRLSRPDAAREIARRVLGEQKPEARNQKSEVSDQQ